MKKIIYIPVSYKIKKKKFINLLIGFYFDFKALIKGFFKINDLNRSTSGFVEQSLKLNFKVIELPYSFSIIFSHLISYFFDAIFINWKFTNFRNDENLENKLIHLCNKFKIKKVLIDTRDTSNKLSEEILDKFDLIIQREKFKDYNHNKIISSMLPCTLIHKNMDMTNIDWKKIGNNKPNDNFKFDIFFSGKATNPSRSKLIEEIKLQNYKFYGGINEKIPYKNYLQTIYDSAINIALDGIGIFTFRHLEIIACCSFLMCSSKINEIDLPINLRDGEDFVSFDNKNDLLEKISFYLKNAELRKKISISGRKKLENNYSPLKHGKLIESKLFGK